MMASEPATHAAEPFEARDTGQRDPRAPLLRVYLLGRFQLRVGDAIVDERSWRLRKAKSLVKLLALAPDRSLLRDEVLDALWPDLDPTAAGNNLRQAISVLRNVLGNHLPPSTNALAVQRDRLVLYPDGDVWIDAHAFETAAGRSRETNDPLAYYATLASYRGDLLPEDQYEDWSQPHRERLRGICLSLLIDVAQLHEVRQEYIHAIQVYERIVTHDQGFELAHVGLMRLYALTSQRSRALRQYQQLRSILAQDLGIEPDASTTLLFNEIATGRFPAPAPALGVTIEHGPSNNLPVQTTRLIGREQDVQVVKTLLQANRLVTLTGAGGCGKTRLALGVAAALVDVYSSGVWFVDLGTLTDERSIHIALTNVLRIREDAGHPLLDSIKAALGGKRLLLVLDTCEHLIEEVSTTARSLLERCDGLTILATSREALRVPGEQTWRVPPLAIPHAGQELQPIALETAASVELFLDRVQLRLPEFTLTPQNAPSIATICRQLDGLPLAIELAAARVSALSVEQIAGNIGNALVILTGGHRATHPRHRTLRAAVDWSVQLLGQGQRLAFQRFAIFAAGWTLEAAQAIVAGETISEDEVIDLLSGLVDASLVQVEQGIDGQRFRLLEPIRQMAWESLEASGEIEALRDRHAAWFLHFAERAEQYLLGPEQRLWADRIEREHDNLRAALRTSEERDDIETALRLAGALARFWWIRGYYAEGRDWLASLLSRTDRRPSTAARARAGAGAALLAYRQGDWQAACDHASEGLMLAEQLQDPGLTAWLLTYQAIAVGELGDGPASIPLLQRSVDLFRSVGDAAGAARALNSLGERARIDGQIDLAAGYYTESLRLLEQAGDLTGISMLQHNLACVAQLAGDAAQATILFAQCLAANRDINDTYGIVSGLLGLAGTAAVAGRSERAARLFGAADRLMTASGITLAMADVPLIEQHTMLARRTLGADQFREHWSAGQQMPVEDAIAYALEGVGDADSDGVSVQAGILTGRELEVAVLVARGMTNHQIARTLGIAHRTVDTHVSNILRKLRLASRAAVRGWIARQPLTA